MPKQAFHALIVASLQSELDMLTRAAMATHAEATDEENKAEDKYDTRGLEASYLAHGQSKAAEETALALSQFQALTLRDFAAHEPISLGALVSLDDGSRYFVGPRAGGTEIEADGVTVLVITPQSPLGHELVGKRQGDQVTLTLGGKRNQLRITSVV